MRRGIAWALAVSLGAGAACTDDDGSVPRPSPVGEPAPAVAAAAPVARVATTDRWLELIAQRPAAVTLYDDKVVVDLGRKAAAKHQALATAGRWAEPNVIADRGAAVVPGKSAELDIPIDGALAPALNPDTEERAGLALAVTLRAAVENQSVTLLLNEKTLAHLRLSSGWERRTLSLPADLVKPGDNRLRFHFRHVSPEDGAAAIARVEVGSHEAIKRPIPDDARVGYHAQLQPGAAPQLQLSAGNSLAWYLVPPRRGRLVVSASGRGQLQVFVSTDADHREGRAPTVVLDEPLRPAGFRREIDLTAWGEQPARLELRARGTEPDAAATVETFEILARRTVPRDERDRAPRDVYVVAIEGARADELLEPGRRPPLTAIEGLVRDSIVFERAYALGGAAVPSHAALLSSVVPPVHLTVAGTFVADAQVMLPEALARAGYVRALVSSNRDVSDERGLHQGFDLVQLFDKGMEEHDARAVIERALKLVAGRKERRLLYAVVNDPQAPYEPPREALPPVPPPPDAPLPHMTRIWVGRVYTRKHEPSADELAYVRRLYRGELRVVDTAIEELVTTLEQGGRLDDSIFVVMGVHGEEFFEHGGAGHAHTLYEESIRVPLMIRAPSLLAGGRVTVPVDLLDLSPTLVDLVGGTPSDGWQGESLVPVIDDPQPPPRLVVAYLGDGSRAAIVGDHKLIVGPGRTERWFDLEADPGEAEDRIAEGGIALRMVRTALAWQSLAGASWKRARWGTGANLRPAFAQDLGM